MRLSEGVQKSIKLLKFIKKSLHKEYPVSRIFKNDLNLTTTSFILVGQIEVERNTKENGAKIFDELMRLKVVPEFLDDVNTTVFKRLNR